MRGLLIGFVVFATGVLTGCLENTVQRNLSDPVSPLAERRHDAGESPPRTPEHRSSPQFDSGSIELIDAMLEAMDLESQSPRTRTIISLGEFRNQSKAAYNELKSAQGRFLDLIAPAAEARGLLLTGEKPAATEYVLSGTAYLIERRGAEYWEIWLALKPIDANWALWRNEDPVRLLRPQVSPDAIVYQTQ